MSFLEYVTGRVEERGADWVVLDVRGFGLRVSVPMGTTGALPAPGAEVKLWTHLYIREDQRAVYGFGSVDERALFVQLLGVSGVGPRTALAALSLYGAEGLAAAIEGGDEAKLKRVPGLGKKTAATIVLHLKGKVAAPAGVAAPASDGVLDALMSFGGLTRGEATALLATLPPDPSRSVEDTLRLAFLAHGARNAR